MATYFDPTNKAHLDLLPAAIRAAPDVAVLAGEVEADVIAHFTRRVNPLTYQQLLTQGELAAQTLVARVATQLGDTQAYVFLRGYTEDADDPDADPRLVTALRRAIAEVLRWRVAQRAGEPDVESKSDGSGASRSYRADRLDAFPPDWDRWLVEFDTREPAWAF